MNTSVTGIPGRGYGFTPATHWRDSVFLFAALHQPAALYRKVKTYYSKSVFIINFSYYSANFYFCKLLY